MRIKLIDLGINNLGSWSYVLEDLGVPYEIATELRDAHEVDAIILPGIGNFGAASARLVETNLIKDIPRLVNSGTRLVGICLGMQLLGDASDESDGQGLGLISGRSKKLSLIEGVRVPNIDWLETLPRRKSPFQSLHLGKDFYFVHSYHFVPSSENVILSESPFGSELFVSAVLDEGILGFQFHPEKSSAVGRELIHQVIEWING